MKASLSPPRPLRLLVASAEVHPYSKTGGLADMVAALAKFLAKAGHRVGLVTPLYRGLRDRFAEIKPFDWELRVPLGGRTMTATVGVARPRPRLTMYFIDQPEFFDRAGLYTDHRMEYSDNPERYIFFSRCVAQLARHLPWRPEVVHLHDWHTGVAPLLIRHQEWHDAWFEAPKTCFTIHNLAYQGQAPAWKYELTNLPWYYFHADGAEFYGGLNLMKSGIAFADVVTTVSPRYAREITTPEFGCGLDGLLRARENVLTGILNGVDYEEWRTTRNPHLTHPFTPRYLAGKTAGKLALQAELGLPPRADTPLFGTISRLEDQKGVDLILGALGEMLGHDLQYVLLGSGQLHYEQGFRALAERHPAKVAVRLGYNGGLAHRIEAGCDFYLMPSRFEPCGLNQMYSLRYGTIPIVRATGGLADVVRDVREDAELANGIQFTEPTSAALAKAIRKALALYAEPDALEHYRRNGMAADFSWEATAERYEAVYRRMLGEGAD